ncbi:MAG: elongation factor P [Proteobacteria bacterium]|nr:MAG: elongation factor P [Pseudomonadota bacterium]PIE17075.1 MAG: elongation factor P [Pseudomonadota bacterium]
MYETSDIRKNLKFQIDGQPYIVVDFQFVKPGKGNAFTRTKIKNMITGAVLEKTYKTGEKLEPAHMEERQMQYLYQEGENYCFMDQSSYEQVFIPADLLGDDALLMPDNLEVSVLFFSERPVGVTLPNFVELQVTQSDPGMKGDTATGATKPATLSTGLVVQVPLFVEEGEFLKIDTRNGGEYVERVKK